LFATINRIFTKQDCQEKKGTYKKQKMENQQLEEQTNLGDKKMLGIDEILAFY
jgi:hypothetical protein